MLILKWYAYFFFSKVDTQSIITFCKFEIAQLEKGIELRGTGLQNLILNLMISTFYMSHLLAEKVYFNIYIWNCISLSNL